MPRVKKVETVETTPTDTGVVAIDIKDEPLQDADEIEVESLIPNVSYFDNKTGDMYRWDEIGHVELMTFGALKDMRRNARTYLNELWIKPKDDRVIKAFGLERLYNNYYSLMDKKSYTNENIDATCKKISESPDGIKWTLIGRIKELAESGEIPNVRVLKSLERLLNVDLVDLI